MRLVLFTFEKLKKLNVSGKEFINNMTVFKKNEAVVGYLFFKIPYDKDETIQEVKFLFKSYNNKIQEVIFKENDIIEEKLFFDDTIWEDFSGNIKI